MSFTSAEGIPSTCWCYGVRGALIAISRKRGGEVLYSPASAPARFAGSKKESLTHLENLRHLRGLASCREAIVRTMTVRQSVDQHFSAWSVKERSPRDMPQRT